MKKRRKYVDLRKKKSIMVDSYDYCVLCGSSYMVDVHHCIHGITSNKQYAEDYGLLVPLCRICHDKLHSQGKDREYLERIAQERFEEVYPELSFLKIFGRNYKYKLEGL